MTDSEILTALREASGRYLAGVELAQLAKLPRTAISSRIQELRALGYEIEASPHKGYRLQSCPDLLHADDLMSRLGKIKVVGRDIRVFKETTSTNDVAEKLAVDGVKEGVVIFAESQSKGRGRLGRRWISTPGKGLWFSVLLRPTLRPIEATRLTIVAATALLRAITTAGGVSAEIKWPNDILIRGKKVAGILTELRAELDQIKYLILGIGVSVNLISTDFPDDLRKTASSLRIETGEAFDRAELASEILRELDHDYARLCSGQFESVAEEWEERCTTIGRNVIIDLTGRTIQGRAECLDSDGALLVRTQHGRLERITGGDVKLEK